MVALVIIGFDDWAIACGHHYGTIVVDLERRRPIELLLGRQMTTVLPRLKAQPGVEVIARDRAGSYADAARTALGLPGRPPIRGIYWPTCATLSSGCSCDAQYR